MSVVNIDYEKVKQSNVRRDAEKAIQILLSGDEGVMVTLSPQALNPLLKALESLGLWKQIIVIPVVGESKPSYTVVKIGQGEQVESFSTSVIY